jgi:hypothetical protein
VVLVAVLAIAGSGLPVFLPRESPSPGSELETPTIAPGGPAALAALPPTRPAVILSPTFLYPAPGRDPVTDEFGENEEIIDAGQVVTVFGDPVVAGLGQWVRVFVEVDPNRWPGDFFAWLPVVQDGRPVLEVGAPVACPVAISLQTLDPLSPWDRLRCAGGAPIELDARVGFGEGYAAYDVEPAFFGGRNEEGVTVSLAPTGGPERLRPWPDDTAIDAVWAPGVEAPPVDFDLRITGQFAHPDAEACQRTRDMEGLNKPPPPGSGVPAEAAADSAAWCRSRFVITDWSILAGPERRPLAPGEVQLHRNNGVNACGGVGMPPLTFRIDIRETDPVWIDTGHGFRIIPTFSDAFRFVPGPEPGIADASGVVIRDGTRVDPDADFAGHVVCPMGSVVSFG